MNILVEGGAEEVVGFFRVFEPVKRFARGRRAIFDVFFNLIIFTDFYDLFVWCFTSYFWIL